MTPEQKASYTRPAGWSAPGPQPAGPQGHADLEPQADEDLSFLTGDWRIFQLKEGHRWSIDDMLTAMVAIQVGRAMPNPMARHLDIGCGIGSVLMMVAWGLPRVKGTGVEAQPRSVQLARRSVRYNGAADRVTVLHGDARDPTILTPDQDFDLVTGTPPYIPAGAGIPSTRPQKGPCCFEERGGIEDYCRVAAGQLAPHGRFVVCSGIQGQPEGRTQRAAAAAGLQILRRVVVVPRRGKPPLFNVDVMAAEPGSAGGDECAAAGGPMLQEELVVREADGQLTEDMLGARELMGLPPPRQRGGPVPAAA